MIAGLLIGFAVGALAGLYAGIRWVAPRSLARLVREQAP